MTNFKGLAVVTAAIALPVFFFVALQGPTSALFSQYLGVSALVAMALSQIIATRARLIEPIFGPLDQAYVLHKWLGICALVAILLHDNIGAEIKALGPDTKLSEFGEGLGEQSLNGLLILLAITLITIIPYRIWYWTHRAMGACFVLGALHFALIQKPFSNLDPLGLYVLGFCTLGIISYAYTLAPRSWRRGHGYTVASVTKTGNAWAITMSPQGHPLRHKPGQFAFFSFEEKGLSETHPFTLSNAPDADGTLRISVGNLGDYTARLGQAVKAGMTLRVHGPYGRFAPQKGKKPQVWIAGGIGITPFLAGLQALKPEGPNIDLFYTYRSAAQAPHLDDVKQMAAAHDRVTLHLFDTSDGPRLTALDIAQATDGAKIRTSFCGPAGLRHALKKELRDFHFEAFEIRTGLPIPKRILGALGGVIQRFWPYPPARV